jgi:hypothetical protein
VRLAVLARPFSSSEKDRDEGEETSSPVAVRKAQLANLDVDLSIASGGDSWIRSVGALSLAGDVTYATDESPEGMLRGSAQNIELGAIAVGPVSITGARLDAVADVEVSFAGATPTHVRADATNLTVEGVHVASRSADGTGAETTGDGAGGNVHGHVPNAPAT